MIRITFLLRRKPGLSLADFQEYWQQKHGPLVASYARTLNMRRYVQVHRLAESDLEKLAGPRGPMEEPFDGVAEVWFWSREDMIATLETDEGRDAGAALIEDEKTFLDLPNSPIFLCYEYPQVNPSPETIVATPGSALVKLYYPLRHRPELSLDEAQLYWRTAHGPLIRANAEAGNIRRYIQVHRFEDELEATLRESRGTTVDPYTGHAELWLDRADMLAAATPERQRGAKLAYEDETTFIDFPRSTMFLAKERVFADFP